jgi:hypothetical protein
MDATPLPADAAHPPGPGVPRATAVIAALVAAVWLLAQYGRGDGGEDPFVAQLGRVEVTARLVDCPDEFPDLGAYRYTYVVEYEVLAVHRQDPSGKYVLRPGERIFVGHYRPRLPRNQIRDADWGDSPLGGRLARIVRGDAHRMALDYELANLAPSGALDYCFPAGVNRFFAVWTNPARP